jgi:hypothetical protein
VSKKVIVEIRDNGDMYDSNNTFIVNTNSLGYIFEAIPEPKVDLAQLMSLGATAEELIKMKANGLF